MGSKILWLGVIAELGLWGWGVRGARKAIEARKGL